MDMNNEVDENLELSVWIEQQKLKMRSRQRERKRRKRERQMRMKKLTEQSSQLSQLNLTALIENIEFLKKIPEPERTKFKNFIRVLLNELYRIKNDEWGIDPLKVLKTIIELSIIAEANLLYPTALKDFWLRANFNNHELLFVLKKFHKLLIEYEKMNIDISFCKTFVEKEVNELGRKLGAPIITWRIKVLIHLYKVKVGIEESLTQKERIARYGKSFDKEYYTFIKEQAEKKRKHNQYKPATKKELAILVNELTDCPIAQKAAINDLAMRK